MTGCRVPGRRGRREGRGELPGGHGGYQKSPDRDLDVLITLEPSFKTFQRLANCLLLSILWMKTLTKPSTNLGSMAPGTARCSCKGIQVNQADSCGAQCLAPNCFFLPCPQLTTGCLPKMSSFLPSFLFTSFSSLTV